MEEQGQSVRRISCRFLVKMVIIDHIVAQLVEITMMKMRVLMHAVKDPFTVIPSGPAARLTGCAAAGEARAWSVRGICGSSC